MTHKAPLFDNPLLNHTNDTDDAAKKKDSESAQPQTLPKFVYNNLVMPGFFIVLWYLKRECFVTIFFAGTFLM